jgi:hypothetical protein
MNAADVNAVSVDAPRWPTEPIIPRRLWVDYDAPADEFLVYFDGKPVPAMSSPLDGPGFEDVAIMIGLGVDGKETGEIVGAQVIPKLLGAVREQPTWAALAWAALAGDLGAKLLRERLPGFLAAVAEAFARYWTPAPPIEEQMARLTQPDGRGNPAALQDSIETVKTA